MGLCGATCVWNSAKDTYDNADRLQTILTKQGATTIVSYTYTVDPVGNRSQAADMNGTTTFGYDGLYRVNAVTYPNADTQSYTYDAMGNRLTKVNNGTTTTYSYDNAGQMTSAGGVTYGYDNNGSLTSRGTDTFAYNATNRLVLSNTAGVVAGYAYNGDGLRTLRAIGGVTTTFAWGQVGGMPVVLADSAGNKYLYGLGLISRTDSLNNKTYYHTDGLGSTTAVTDATGGVLNTYQYDVYGALRAQTGTTPNEFTYTGQQTDSSGLQYLRARYYDPTTGRFLTKDPLPLLQRYAYVGDNPVNVTDPMGLCGANCAWNKVVDTFDKAGSLIADCIGSDTCTKMVGEGVFLVGAVTGNPLVMAIGVGVMAGVDAPSCAGGSTMGCVNLGLDAAALTAAAPGLSDALGRGLGQLLADESGTIRLGGSAPAISMDQAVADAVEHVGPSGFMEVTGKGLNFQFRSMATDDGGNIVARMGRFDINPADPGVQVQGPHLNLETQLNGRRVGNTHIPIDPQTIRPGDFP